MSRRVSLPLLSSILYILAFPNFNQAWIAWIALIPLTLYTLQASPKQAFYGGWLSGTLAYCGMLYWLIITFQAAHQSMGLALLSLVSLSAYLGLYWGIWAWCTSRAHSGAPLRVSLFAAAAWTALEFARAYLFTGFPWTLLGDTQVYHPVVIQIVSMTGVYGLSFLIVLVNIALAQLIRSSSRQIGGALLAAALTFSSLAFGFYRLHHVPVCSPVRSISVALLQGSIDQYKKWDKAYVEDIEKTYQALAQRAAASHPQLILWPETSVPGYLLQDPPLRAWLNQLVLQTGAYHIAGAPVMHGKKAYNSAFALDPQGHYLGEYSKIHLVPFGEEVPWADVLGRFIHVLNDLGGFAAGDHCVLLPAHGIRIGVNICYEAIFPAIIRTSVKEGAEMIANLTNDGWYMKTAAPHQHFAPNILRAVENARWLVRADNTGISAIIDPYGRIQAASRIFEPAVILGAVQPRQDLTLYTRLGDWFAWLCLGLVLLGLAIPWAL